MLPTQDEPSKVEPGQLEDVSATTVGLLKEDGCDFVGVGKLAYDVQFGDGDGEALYIQLEQ